MLQLLKYCKNVFQLIATSFSRSIVSYDDGNWRRVREDANATSYSIDRLPNEIFLCISEHLTKKDCVTCMSVCKLWLNRFFERVYGIVYLTETSQIISFYKVVKRMDHTLTETVSTLRLDHHATGAIWTNFSAFQRVIVLCTNIKALDLSWWQLYFLLHPTHNRFKATFHLRQLRKLTIRSTYQTARAVELSKEHVSAVPVRHDDPKTDPLFRASKLLLELIRHTPKLDNLSVYFHRLDDPWMTEKDLEAIHAYCPSLRTLLLKNTIWTLEDHDSITTCYPAEHMRRLTLGNIEFQDNAGSLWQYILCKYQKVTYAAIWQVRMQDEKAKEAMMAGASLWRDLHTFEFKSAMTNTADICKSFLVLTGNNIACLELGGVRRGDRRRRKYHAISVNLSWINEVCVSLKKLALTYAVVYIDQEVEMRPSGQLGPREFVTHLTLERASHVEPWLIQELTRGPA